VIGVTVEYFGKAAAEGFLHDFEGWFVFMACGGMLLLEMWALARLGRDPRPLGEVFGITIPDPLPETALFRERRLPTQYWVAALAIALTLGGSFTLVERQEIIPNRADFSQFPLQLGEWTGHRERMEQKYIDQLKFEDYLLADYTKAGAHYPVNLYVAYYETQRKGESIHSPSSCIPGGGWQITSHEIVSLRTSNPTHRSMPVNRLLIQKGEDRQLVYYWFQQRGRIMTNEYMIKWYLFWDAITKNRSDGALVRLTTISPRGEELADADQRLTELLDQAIGKLPQFIPE
ncbi:MAG: EpsI family protein, partial [Methylococcaceae bacterium]|nr:EpsI family protein [Methylococcaceae bacterium]